MATRRLLPVARPVLELRGAAGGGGRGGLHRAWRRGLGVCLVMVVATFSFFLVSSPHRARITLLTHRSPEYLLDLLMMPSNTTSSVQASPSQASPKSPQSPSPTSRKNPQGSSGVPKGFLVYSSSCTIPDLDPFHPSIKKFLSPPKPIICNGPPAFTSARGSTLRLHLDILRRHIDVFQQIYWNKLTTTTTTPLKPSSTTTTTTRRPTSTSSATTTTTTTRKPTSTSSTTTTTTTTATTTTATTTTTTTTTSIIPTTRTSSSKASPTSSSSSSSPSSSTTKEGKVKVDVDAVVCCYKGIYRVEQPREKAGGSADGRWRYNDVCQPLNVSGVEVQEEAALVLCSIGKFVVYKNIHYFFRKRENYLVPFVPGGTGNPPSGTNASAVHVTGSTNTTPVNTQTKDSPTSPSGTSQPSTAPASTKRLERVEGAEKLSVIFIGTDSVSRLNMLRHLPKTYEYLTKKLGAVDLQGYNKVEDNTFPNLVAHLGGYTYQEVDKDPCLTKSRHYDDCQWVWKDFKRNGYVTAYMEDAPSMGTFHYLRRGFISKPTDFYGRPFFLASEKEIGRGRMCQGAELSIKVIQDYSLEYARTFLGTPSFGFFWSASLTHDHVNLIRQADDPYLLYVKGLDEMGALNNTALFFVSDHGMRWGSLRATYVGMLEERLPYVIVYLPPWFKEKYHRAYDNMVTNTHRLTSNFDVHETLLDFAYGRFADLDYVTSAPSRTKRGTSLFRTVAWNRTCAEAGIPQHYCACQDTLEVAKNDTKAGPAVAFLKDSLNNWLLPYPQCEQFSKVKVVSARVTRTNKELKQKQLESEVRTYLIQATLTPGDVVVEASLRHSQQDNSFTVLGTVSRINMYGATSACVQDDQLRKFCYCRDQAKAKKLFKEKAKQQEGTEVGSGDQRKRRRRNVA